MKNFVNGYYNLCIWVTKLAYLNLIWVVFTVMGLVAFGFMPASAGMFAVVRKWTSGEKDIPIFKVFWKSYKAEFLRANGLGVILFGIGYLLSIEFQILRSQDNMAYFIASFGVIALFLLYFIILLYFFPIFVHFNLRIGQYLKWPFIIGIVHPILTLFLIVVVTLINYAVFLTIPGLLFFFGGSVTAYIITWGVSKTFPNYEQSKSR